MNGRVTSYSPGEWVAITSEDGWLLAEIDPTDLTSLVAWGLLRNHAALDAVLDALLAKGLQAVRNFVLAKRNDDESASIVVRGAGLVLVEREGAETERISGQDVATWRETSVPAGWSSLQLTAGSTGFEQPGLGEGAGPLSPGVTLAGVIRVVDQSRAAPHPARHEQHGQADSQQDGRLDSLAVEAAAAESGPGDYGQDSHGLGQPMMPVADVPAGQPEMLAPAPTQAVPIAELFGDDLGHGASRDAGLEHTSRDSSQPADESAVQPPAEPEQQLGQSGPESAGGAHALQPAAEMARQPEGQGEPYRDAQPQHDAQPQVGRPVEADSAPPVQAPMVDTVRCEAGHLNPLTVANCRVCGTQLRPQVPSRQPRPPLGVLRMSTGAAIPLDRDVVFGRTPSVEAAGVPNDARLITIDSPKQDTSRTHCAIHLDGWVALIADLNSTNGTTMTRPTGQSDRLPPNQPVVLEPGSTVNIANEVSFRYEPVA